MPINENLAKLILRATVGGLMIFHGVYKLINGHDFIRSKLIDSGLPEFLTYGVPVGEILAPALIILGYKTRLSALVVAFTMVMSIFLVFSDKLFSLNQNGGIAYELNLFFLMASIAIYFQGPGQYALSPKVSAID